MASPRASLHLSGPLPSEKQLKQSLKSLKYSQNGLTAKHIMASIEQFPDLKPSIKECTYSDPRIRGVTLIQLSGSLTSKNSVSDGDEFEQLKIPVRVWLKKGYPRDAPVVYINLAPNMEFIEAEYIEADGKVNLGQIMSWKEVGCMASLLQYSVIYYRASISDLEGKCDLCLLTQELCAKFSQQCPIRLLKLRSSSNQFTFRQLKPSHSTFSLRETNRNSQTALFRPQSDCNHDEEQTKLRAEIEEKNSEIESLQDTLEDTRAKVGYYRNQASELEEKLTATKKNVRGSFSTGIFDALMEHDVWKEKEEKEECMMRMERMVTDLTELRERVGVLQADKKEYRDRLSLMAIEYERIKFVYCKLVEERKFLIARQRQLAGSDSDDSADAEYESQQENIADDQDTRMEEGVVSDDERTGATERLPSVVEGNHQQEDDVIDTQTAAGITITVSEAKLPKAEDTATPTKSLKDTLSNTMMQNETLEQEITVLREKTLAQEVQVKSLTKKINELEKEGKDSNEMLKKLLDDAMRKIRKYEFCADKEDQLEKQKQFLQSQLERSVTYRLEAEKKLRDENWKTRQKLKEVMNKAEQLEHEVNSQKGSRSPPSSTEEGLPQQRLTAEEEMGSVLKHLDVLLSN